MYQQPKTPEQWEKRRAYNKAYRDKVYARYKAFPIVQAAFEKMSRMFLYSMIANVVLFIACILGWIF